MKLEAYIQRLEELKALHGDLEVTTDGFCGAVSATSPEISHMKILQGREWKSRFWSTIDKPEAKGQKVVRV